MAPTISGVYVYPVKSCHAVSVPAVAVTPSGLAWDRQWMVVDGSTGKFLTQRQEPRLAVIQPLLPAEAFSGAVLATGAELVLSAPGVAQALRVPLAPQREREIRRVTVWEWTGGAYDEGEAAAAWLSGFLGRPVRLVRYIGNDSAASDGAAGEPVARPTDAAFCSGEVAFPDGFPILVASEDSLADLNARLPEPLPMARFRPNLVVAGVGRPFAEDAWGRIIVAPAAADGAVGGAGGGIDMEVVRPCDRCGLPSVDQEAGVKKEPNPLDTLSKYRTGKILGWAGARKAWTHSSFFATFVQPVAGGGVVRVGDAVGVTAERSWES